MDKEGKKGRRGRGVRKSRDCKKGECEAKRSSRERKWTGKKRGGRQGKWKKVNHLRWKDVPRTSRSYCYRNASDVLHTSLAFVAVMRRLLQKEK